MRGFRFNEQLIKDCPVRRPSQIAVTTGQISFEVGHLQRKISKRVSPAAGRELGRAVHKTHPLFRLARGPIAEWERGA